MNASLVWVLLLSASIVQPDDPTLPFSVGEEMRMTPQGVNIHRGGNKLTLLLDGSQQVWVAIKHAPAGSLAFWSPRDGEYRDVELPDRFRPTEDKSEFIDRGAYETYVNDGAIQLVLIESQQGTRQYRVQTVTIADWSPESNTLTPRHTIEMKEFGPPPFKTNPLGRKESWNPLRVFPCGKDGYLFFGEYSRTYLSQILFMEENTYDNFFGAFWNEGAYGPYERISHGGRSTAWGMHFIQSRNGTTHVSWTRKSHPFQFDQRIYYASISGGGIVAKPRVVGSGYSNKAIALWNDDVYLFWTKLEDDARQDMKTRTTSHERPMYVELKSGKWSEPRALSFPELESYEGERMPEIAACAGPDGALYVALALAERLFFMARLDGAWKEPIALDSPVGAILDPQIVVDSGGVVHLAYLKQIRNFGSDPETITQHSLPYSLERGELDPIRRGGVFPIAIYRRLNPARATSSVEGVQGKEAQ